VGSAEWGVRSGSAECGVGSGERGVGNAERGMRSGDRIPLGRLCAIARRESRTERWIRLEVTAEQPQGEA
jgi:hypothetical protein